jgi:hypothetical protein
MLTRNVTLAVVFVAAAGGGWAARAQAPNPDVSKRALTKVAVDYVADYKKQFAFLIADEEYTQTQFDADGRTAQTRVLKAELFLTYLAADDEWMAVRDVIEVDGRPVRDREDLRALLLKSGERRLIKALAERNARFNIGRMERTFNEPTLPLLLLDPKRVSRVKLDRRAVTAAPDATLATLSFEERDRPTLIRTHDGESIRGKGELLIDARTGAVRHTIFQFTLPGVDVKLETAYARDEKLNLWLPSVFTERYESGGNVGGRRARNQLEHASHELIECVAKYSNYRRFDVTVRIK